MSGRSKTVPMNFKGMAAGGCSARSQWKAQSDCDQDPLGSRSDTGGRRAQGAIGTIDSQQGERTVSVESRDSERRTQRCHRQRWYFLVCVERNAVEDDRCAIERSADAVEGTVTKSAVPTKHPVRLDCVPPSVVTNHASVGFSSVRSGNLAFAAADPRDACLSTRV